MNTLQIPCPHCNQPVTFEAKQVGAIASCPHCANALGLTVPGHQPAPKKKSVSGAAIIVIILGLAMMTCSTLADAGNDNALHQIYYQVNFMAGVLLVAIGATRARG